VDEAKVEHDEATAEFGPVSHQEVSRLQVAVNQAEIVKEAEGAQGLGNEAGKDSGALVSDGRHEVASLDEFKGEPRTEVLGDVELVDLDEVGMPEASEGRELAPELLLVAQVLMPRPGELLQSEGIARVEPVLHQPDPAGASLSQHLSEEVPAARRVFPIHRQSIGPHSVNQN